MEECDTGNLGIQTVYTVKGSYAVDFFRLHYPAAEIKYLYDTEDSAFFYCLDQNTNAVITGYTGNAANITIPGSIDGHYVTKIGNDAFDAESEIVIECKAGSEAARYAEEHQMTRIPMVKEK